MARDAEESRERILDAALTEFAERGIAGARVDRIAAEAGLSKGLIYTHFGSKDDLFDAVFDSIVERTLTEMPIDADDLPEYAGRLFDSYVAHPEVPRIAIWHRLERATTGSVIPSIVASSEQKIAAIRDAQERGVVSQRFTAEQLFLLVLTISIMWSSSSGEMVELATGPGDVNTFRRQTVVDAVRRLVTE